MSPGIGEEGVKAVGGFIKVFQNEPLSLALVAMNICLMAFFYFLLTTVAAQREREIGLLYADKKEVRDMLAKCVVPDKSTWRTPFKSLVKTPDPVNILLETKQGE